MRLGGAETVGHRAGAVAVLLAAVVHQGGPGAPAVHAQGVRGWTGSTVRYVELRPVVQETAPPDQLVVEPDGTLTYRGRRVFCVPEGPCTYYRAAAPEHTLDGAQDVAFTAWGLGVQGLSVTGLVRARARLDGEFVWPRSDDRFDAMLAYAQLDRGSFRVRLGRQRTLSGLGFSGFDGAGVRYTPSGALTVEAYGGRSLARALNEPRKDALAGLVDFLPDHDAWLLGGFARVRLPSVTSFGLRYQREILGDRSGLVSERASLDWTTGWLRPVMVTGSLDYDVALDRMGKSHLTARYAGPALPVAMELTGRRYVPYFELSTVWGLFDPVAYHEALARVSWTGADGTLWAAGGLRAYEDADAGVFLDPLEDDAWQLHAGGTWRPPGAWTVDGRWEMLWGVGGFLHSVEVTARYRPGDRLEVAAHGTAFQQFEEFRVGEGRTWGGGVSAGVELGDRVRLEGGLSVFRHDPEGRQVDERWNQLRGWSALRVEFGSEPGRSGPRFRR